MFILGKSLFYLAVGAQTPVVVASAPRLHDSLTTDGAYVYFATQLPNRTRFDSTAEKANPLALRIAPGFPLAAALGDGRIAVADPDSVPAGRYARSALTSLGVWGSVAERLVRAENVRVALTYVARGEAPLGIVYETDAKAEPLVRVVDVFPKDTHQPIVYPAALTRAGTSSEAKAFLSFVSGDAASASFMKHGFIVLP